MRLRDDAAVVLERQAALSRKFADGTGVVPAQSHA
jgi:hypothetical protein